MCQFVLKAIQILFGQHHAECNKDYGGLLADYHVDLGLNIAGNSQNA